MDDLDRFGGLVVAFDAELSENAGGNAVDEFGEGTFRAFLQGSLARSGFPVVRLNSGQCAASVVV